MDRINPHRRPRYEPFERMAILELRAARGWSLKQTVYTFRVAAATIASWSARLDEGGLGPSAVCWFRGVFLRSLPAPSRATFLNLGFFSIF
jgi:hypothetical protein